MVCCCFQTATAYTELQLNAPIPFRITKLLPAAVGHFDNDSDV